MVGRNLMLHNNSSLIAMSRTPNPTRFQKTLGINDYYDGDGEWEYPLGAMQMLGKSDAYTMSLDAPDARRPGRPRGALVGLLADNGRPGRSRQPRHGRCRRSDHLTYTPTNLEAHDRLKATFRGLLDAMRCQDEVLGRHTYLGGKLGISPSPTRTARPASAPIRRPTCST